MGADQSNFTPEDAEINVVAGCYSGRSTGDSFAMYKIDS